mmetsp:Transcript_22253/g.50816  ORF Transcript_22253/g.50816 Transcript_22253/m.50816 type:complete len:620 (+) Transcript_22253:99-1958(+)
MDGTEGFAMAAGGAVQTGVVKAWIEERGMGFIKPDTAAEDLFVHRSHITNSQWLSVGATVTFEEGFDGMKGKRIAKQVVVTGGMQLSAAPVAAAAPAAPAIAVDPSGWQTGTVKMWMEDKAFGFIVPDAGGDDVMIHKNNILSGQPLESGMQVQFAAQWDASKGKMKATSCAPISYGAAVVQQQVAAVQYAMPMACPYAAPMAAPMAVAVPQQQQLPCDNLFISGLPLGTSEDQIREVFTPYGTISSIRILPNTGAKPDTAALVQMVDIAMAQWMVENLDGNIPVGLSTPIGVRYSQRTSGKASGKGAPAYGAPQVGYSAPSAAPVACYGAPGQVDTSGMVPGVVKAWYEQKGMGFLAPDYGGDDVFVHRSALIDTQSLAPNQQVFFEEGWDTAKGKRMATRCMLTGGYAAPASASYAAGGYAAAPASGSYAAPQQAQNLRQGTVKMWMEDKAFGFIIPLDGGDDVMIHKNEVTPGLQLVPGMSVQFAAQWDAVKGKYKATLCTTGRESSVSGQAAEEGPPSQPQNNLFVSGLPADITEEKVIEIFTPYGQISACKVVGPDGNAANAALVTMVDLNMAIWMVENLDGNIPVGLSTPIQVRYENAAGGARAGRPSRFSPY